ncbi:hypothetical protein COW36_02800 [bacterium (Candidatus Blackallbacteria) CG17_big_fil_post_rev_8_21_14_2_50_48_46]|uniref:Cytidyltransferase n=1 Tax=bacterium (Candidatus Blackallbacteria) CG17_big_fil_post_rev_8_21_14_2_50_48_46 TaxID=2014261 RepID=A0A2M7GAV8_9BACT|nr:MAG: hypothetical protein COW64_12675 [bacterium (Candidatus Blackallbacteria) CG18_big_fil_WC_8_21_14_2_50_49_26]PIW19057.1 MAG: hypothetical protein COW36_02800 [bacterium (Candidatus Blackallbacteria) CG17_big_fil_post_rev_8_21_14_2_50_48_46]PIW44576.1 MAG: hypothetical protein COW20_23320 [bacterium (Candidatus Blackallbacteria) CG13_big_fil_rev_8_21_14_2_50_49_14]
MNEQIVLCHGCFDVLHTGHIYHLEKAKALGTKLIVSITHEDFAKRKLRFSAEIRKHALESLSFVDQVIVVRDRTAETAILEVKPSFYVKGKEYEELELDPSGDIYREKTAVESVGGQLVFTDDEIHFSATKLKASNGPFKDISEAYDFRLADILSFIHDVSELKVCVIGETIIDRWTPVTAEGVSNKSTCPTALVKGSSQDQLGGAYVIASHLAGFVKQLDLITPDFRSVCELPLDERIHHRFYTQGHIIKERLYDPNLNTKIFEVKRYHLPEGYENSIDLEDYDVVIIADFGHQMISRQCAARLSGLTHSFLAVMAQTNSSNLGFNRIDKYPQAHLYCIDTKEMMLCLNLNEPVNWEHHLKEIQKYISFDQLLVTRGTDGAFHYNGEAIHSFPALSAQIVDPIGAGDAFFSLAALAGYLNYPPEKTLLLGSLAGAMNTQWLCNKYSIEPGMLIESAKKVI